MKKTNKRRFYANGMTPDGGTESLFSGTNLPGFPYSPNAIIEDPPLDPSPEVEDDNRPKMPVAPTFSPVDASKMSLSGSKGTGSLTIDPNLINEMKNNEAEKTATWTILGVTWKKLYWVLTFAAVALLLTVLAIWANKK